MSLELLDPTTATQFVDRRKERDPNYTGREHRQFTDSYNGLTPEARELAEGVDGYKLRHRRRFISYEELLDVVRSLGYHR